MPSTAYSPATPAPIPTPATAPARSSHRAITTGSTTASYGSTEASAEPVCTTYSATARPTSRVSVAVVPYSVVDRIQPNAVSSQNRLTAVVRGHAAGSAASSSNTSSGGLNSSVDGYAKPCASIAAANTASRTTSG